MKTLETSQQQDLLPMELPLMLSQEGSHAKILVPRAAEMALKVRVRDYGVSFAALLATYDQASRSWRTYGDYWRDPLSNQAHGLGVFSQTWPRSGMMQSGIAYQLQQLVPNTIGIESGLLPTPIKTDGFTINQFSVQSQLQTECNGYQPRFWARLAAEGQSLTEICQTYESMMGFPKRHTDLEPSETP